MRRNLLTVAASVAVAVVAAEIALRAIGLSFPHFDRLDSRLGWTPRPGIEGTYAFEGRTHLAFNAEGFRDVDHARAKPEGVLRVAVVGDSFTEAREVALDDTFWKVMERGLDACVANARVEVLAFAVNGYGTAQELLLLERAVWPYRPDLVVLAFFASNDVSNNSRVLDGHPNRPYFVIEDGRLVLDDSNLESLGFTVRKVWDEVRYAVYNRLRTLQLARQAYLRVKYGAKYRDATVAEQLLAGLRPHAYTPPPGPAWREAWRVTEALIREMRDRAAAHGADFWIAGLSSPAQVHPDAAVREAIAEALGVDDLLYADRRVARLAAAEDIPHVALVAPLRAYAERTGAKLHGFGDFAGGHWNETGHRVAGEALAAALCDRLAPAETPAGG